MKIEDLKTKIFDTGSIKCDDYYTILEHFGFLDKLELIKEKYKEGKLDDLIDYDELTSKGYELGWDDGSRLICNLRNVLTDSQALELLFKAGSTVELEREIFAIYLKSALREVALYLMYLVNCE